MKKKDDWVWIAGIVGFAALAGTGTAMAAGGYLSPQQIANFASNAGFSGNDLITAVAVALGESGGNPNALGDKGIGQGSFGLWQINSKYHPEFGPDFTALYDPQANANAAYSVYANAGHTFQPWTVYKTGTYAEYLSQVQSALGA